MQQQYAFLAQQFAYFEQPVVILDLESTSGNGKNSHIIEVAFLRFDGKSVQRYEQLVNPQQPISRYVSKLTGITNEMVAAAPTFAQIADDLLPLLSDTVLVAHHSDSDYSLLRREFARMGVVFHTAALCTVELSQFLYPDEKKHSLETLIERFDLTVNGDRHRAWADVAVLADFLTLTLQQHADSWKQAAMTLLKPKILPKGTPPHLRKALAKVEDGYGVAVLHRTDGVKLLACKHGYRDVVALLHKCWNDIEVFREIEWHPSVGELHNLVIHAHLARQYGVDFGESGRQTIVFYDDSGCLKAKIQPLACGIFTQPPTGVFFETEDAAAALQSWAGMQGVCPMRLGILSPPLPQNAPCPVAKSCVCRQTNVPTHNLRVKMGFSRFPTRDWATFARCKIVETDKISDKSITFILERGALQIGECEWLVSRKVFDILRYKIKYDRQNISEA